MWDVNRAAFTRNFQLITLDLPGFGASAPLPEETASMSSMASAIWRTLDSLNIVKPVVMLGLSMGGYVAFRAFNEHPERVRSLVLVSTKATPDAPAAKEGRFKNIELVKKDGLKPLAAKMTPALLGKTTQANNVALVDQVRSSIEAGLADGVCAALRGMAERPDSTPLLERIKVPVLALAGDEDAVVPSTDMQSIAAGVKKGDFDILRGAGHLLNLEQPDAFRDKVLTFLKRRVL